MLKDSAAEVDLSSRAVGPAHSHVIRRSLPASVERLRGIFLDPEQRAAWVMCDTLTRILPPVISAHGDVFLKEYVQGQVVNISVRFLHRRSICEVYVELRMSSSFSLPDLFDLGIDDLWETRLYAIADLLRPEPFTTTL